MQKNNLNMRKSLKVFWFGKQIGRGEEYKHMDFYDILICLLLKREHCVPYKQWLVHSINRQILDIQITLIRSGKKKKSEVCTQKLYQNSKKQIQDKINWPCNQFINSGSKCRTPNKFCKKIQREKCNLNKIFEHRARHMIFKFSFGIYNFIQFPR